jgi:hypothetical protein
MELQDLLAPVASEFDIEEALESWRWLVPESVRALVVTAMGDLFIVAEDGSVSFLDTTGGTRQRVAASVAEWEHKLEDVEALDGWFIPGLICLLRASVSLCQGECYSPIHPPVLGGTYSVDNWRPVHWRVHFSHSGRIHEAKIYLTAPLSQSGTTRSFSGIASVRTYVSSGLAAKFPGAD